MNRIPASFVRLALIAAIVLSGGLSAVHFHGHPAHDHALANSDLQHAGVEHSHHGHHHGPLPCRSDSEESPLSLTGHEVCPLCQLLANHHLELPSEPIRMVLCDRSVARVATRPGHRTVGFSSYYSRGPPAA